MIAYPIQHAVRPTVKDTRQKFWYRNGKIYRNNEHNERTVVLVGGDIKNKVIDVIDITDVIDVTSG